MAKGAKAMWDARNAACLQWQEDNGMTNKKEEMNRKQWGRYAKKKPRAPTERKPDEDVSPCCLQMNHGVRGRCA